MAEKAYLNFGVERDLPARFDGQITQSFYIPMRDGVRLAVDLILPKGLAPGEKIPALLSQSRYWRAFEMRAPFKWVLKPSILDPYFADFSPFFTGQGFAMVNLDVRGTGASFGVWPHPWHSDTLEDAREIVDWIIAQPWSNGKVGAHGISYLGTTAEMLVMLNHPAVKCVIPMFNHPDAFTDIAFPGGLFNDRFIKSWGYFDEILDQNILPDEFGILGKMLFLGVKPVDEDKDRKLLAAAVDEHKSNGNSHRMAQGVDFRDQATQNGAGAIDEMTVHHFKNKVSSSETVTCGWASWLDAGTADAAIRRFLTYDNARMAVIGAWEHGGRFNASPYRPPVGPGSPPLSGQWQEMKRFFDAYLSNTPGDTPAEKVLYYYTLGEEVWKMTHTWPPEGTESQRWYLSERHSLALEPPVQDNGQDAYDIDFEVDSGAYNRWWEMGVLDNKSVIYTDRSEIDRRLLTYTSPPLANDLEISGYPVIKLFITSTHDDGAFFIYLEDVAPDGQVTYITEGLLRAIHRKVSESEPPYKLQAPYHTFKQADALPLIPGEIAELHFGLQPTSALIKAGHSLRIAIAGHDKGTFLRIPAEGNPSITVSREATHASYIDLPVIQRG